MRPLESTLEYLSRIIALITLFAGWLYYDTLVVPYTEVVMSSNQFLLMLHLLYKN